MYKRQLHTHRLIQWSAAGEVCDVRESHYRFIHKWFSDLPRGSSATVEVMATRRVIHSK